MDPTRTLLPRRAITGGVIAGLIGGAVLELYLLGIALLHGADVWPIVKAAAAPLLGARAQHGGFDLASVVIGLTCHFAVAIAWAVVFALMIYGISRPATVLAGIAWGVMVWAIMYIAVLPLLGLGQLASAAPTGRAVLAHMVYGLAIGVGFVPFQVREPLAPMRPLGAP
ncbi:MAG TPA: DUF6789 family protein [Kofleriaceae bacterium]|nr:DUF6789 family protein [Kofleriaceae bacterium]